MGIGGAGHEVSDGTNTQFLLLDLQLVRLATGCHIIYYYHSSMSL